MYQHARAMHQQVHSINSSAVELSTSRSIQTARKLGGMRLIRKSSFRLIAKISQAKLANSRGVNWHSPLKFWSDQGSKLPWHGIEQTRVCESYAPAGAFNRLSK